MSDEPKPAPQLEETADARPYEPPRRTSRLAVAALVCVCASPVIFVAAYLAAQRFGLDLALMLVGPGLALAAVALGFRALWAIRRSGFTLRGRRRAIGSMAGGLVCATLMGLAFGPLSTSAEFIWSLSCNSCVHEIAIACRQHAEEHTGDLPDDPGILCPDRLDPRDFSCARRPARWQEIGERRAITAQSSSYVYVSGLKAHYPGDCLLLFERRAGHFRKHLCSRLDGSLTLLSGDELQTDLAATHEAVKKRGGEIRLVGE